MIAQWRPHAALARLRQNWSKRRIATEVVVAVVGLVALALVWWVSGSIEDRTLQANSHLAGNTAIFVLAALVHLRLQRLFEPAKAAIVVAFCAYVASIGALSVVFATGTVDGISALVIVILVDLVGFADREERTLVRKPVSIKAEIAGGSVAVATLLIINAVGGEVAIWTSAVMGIAAVLYWLWAQRMGLAFPRIALVALFAIAVGTLVQAQADRTPTADAGNPWIVTYAAVSAWYFWMVIRDKRRGWN